MMMMKKKNSAEDDISSLRTHAILVSLFALMVEAVIFVALVFMMVTDASVSNVVTTLCLMGVIVGAMFASHYALRQALSV